MTPAANSMEHWASASVCGRLRTRGRTKGFTLLEVLLAVALFALAVSVLAASYINIMQGLESVKVDHAFEQELRWVREQVMLEPDLKLLEKGGEAKSLEFGSVRWDVEVQPTAIADLFSVQLHVAFGEEKNKAREQTESFMLLRPSWSDPIERDKLRTELRKRVEDERRQMGLTSKKAP